MAIAIGYTRVSTAEQVEQGVSLDMQVERLTSYCAAMDLKPIEIIREQGVSGGKPLSERPGGKRLLALLEAGLATTVVALKLDRLFRSTEDALQRITQWDQQGITLHLTDMGGQTLNTGSAMGRMMYVLLVSFAEFERNLIAERTSAALAHQKANGRVYNHAPYGYRRNGKDLVPHDEETKVLRLVFLWRHEGLSFNAIAQRLNDLRVPAKRGGRWHCATIAHIYQNSLYREFRNATSKGKGPSREPAEAKLLEQMMGLAKDLNTPGG